MKKYLLTFVITTVVFVIPLQAQNQKFKLAVYATGNMEMPLKNIAQNTASTELVNGGRYQMIERSSEFLKIVSTEQNYQRSGEVDDNQIAELGKQYGADCVCVVDITYLDTYLYVATRMIDVVKATSQSAGDAENTNYSTPADLRKCVIASVKKMEGIKKNNNEQIIAEQKDQEELERQRIIEAEQKRIEAEQAAKTAKANQMDGVFGQQKQGSSGWAVNDYGRGRGVFGQQISGVGQSAGSGTAGNPAGKGSSGGNSWSLNGRDLKGSLYKPSYNSNEEGKVVVSIRVNENGDVVAASIASGTTISDSDLRNAAINAAKKTKFTSGTNVVIGTITYNFKLN